MSWRSPVVALLLSLLVPGLGHQYVGEARLARRIVVAVAMAVLLLASVLRLGLDPLIWLVSFAAVTLSLVLGLAIDAGIRAERSGNTYSLQPCNRTGAYAWTVVAVALLVWVPIEVVRSWARTFKVPTDTNTPGLFAEDHILVTTFEARDRDPQRGDLIVYESPTSREALVIHRVIGLAGETLEFRPEGVQVDGVALTREPVAPPSADRTDAAHHYFEEHTPEGARYLIHEPPLDPWRDSRGDAPVFVVPDDHVFVVGDNRSESHDSRFTGPIPLDTIVGRVRAVWLPLDHARSLP